MVRSNDDLIHIINYFQTAMTLLQCCVEPLAYQTHLVIAKCEAKETLLKKIVQLPDSMDQSRIYGQLFKCGHSLFC